MAALHARVFTSHPQPWSAAAFAGLLAEPAVFCVVRDGGLLVGRAVAGEAELLTLAVAPERRRRGTGRALVMAFEAEAARRGAGRAFLEVAEDNAAARSLYSALGWRECGRRRGYYATASGGRVDAVIMERALAISVDGE
ncbi:ribosomal-protein-alanine N-acetyltransferase [Meinhardsimonia xiamenensis]|jgi:ribosomal-protein-alanine N-acetyltransferase|uniref:Ribosomal-protein-alanine N-acetyltransferase n=1 Tax=Meinhardsimonia xiamenensis TaxID=990712 RepID=A0A1G8Z0B2_9RHOB|nr:GNAT family N-acetyltransferase [Meinhardsimonia xiamenensis]PRX37503.1 ribosomal-protein-alanine N-acetyltransferase [Meinhardsimonia xiamenensis]SDK08476.1 ribosomal-protein-alanine N-acetyltransferase [Meinhardsimonia xiamenensis]